MEQKIECMYKMWKWISFDPNIYTCFVHDNMIQPNAVLEFIGNHLPDKSNLEVEGIFFYKCDISNEMPKNLTKIFPNLKFFQIYKCKLKQIRREDLAEYSNCKVLFFRENEIEYLPGDLFSGLKNLEVISFADNKIQVIDSKLLDGLNNLKFVDLSRNTCVDKCFDSALEAGNITLNELKKEIREKFSTPGLKFLMQELNKLTTKHHDGMCKDIKNIILDEDFKDFTVTVEEEDYKCHKLLLAARSPVLAEMIKNNIDAEYLNLVDISTEIFREILKFIYTDELPTNDDINFVHLFIAADKLKIEKLKTFAAQKLIAKVNADNAFDMLELSNKYDNKELRQKSFLKIKKLLGNDKLENKLATQSGTIAELLKLKEDKDEIEAKTKAIIKNTLQNI